MTGPSGWSSPQKKPDQSCWPDEKPSTDHSGKRIGRLLIWHPVYVARGPSSGRKWFYLCICDCSREIIISNVTQSRSCGCARDEAVQRMFEGRRKANENRVKEKRTTRASRMKRVSKFDRLTICNRLPFQCKHYSGCQDERLEGKPTSSRYREGGCYTAGRDELRYMEGIAP